MQQKKYSVDRRSQSTIRIHHSLNQRNYADIFIMPPGKVSKGTPSQKREQSKKLGRNIEHASDRFDRTSEEVNDLKERLAGTMDENEQKEIQEEIDRREAKLQTAKGVVTREPESEHQKAGNSNSAGSGQEQAGPYPGHAAGKRPEPADPGSAAAQDRQSEPVGLESHAAGDRQSEPADLESAGQRQPEAIKQEEGEQSKVPWDNDDVPMEGAADDDAYESDGDEEDELSGMGTKEYKEAMGLDTTQCQVRAKKSTPRGGDVAFTQYGPKSHAKFRIEPGSQVESFDGNDSSVPDVTAEGYRIGMIQDGKRWRYGKANFDKIIAVAWKPADDTNPLNDIDPDRAKERKRYGETGVMIQWKGIAEVDRLYYHNKDRDAPKTPRILENGKLRTWETRTVARRVFPIVKKGSADRALFLQAKKAEEAHENWQKDKGSGRDVTMTPAPEAMALDGGNQSGEKPPATPTPPPTASTDSSKKPKANVQFQEPPSTATATPTPTPAPTGTPAPTEGNQAAAPQGSSASRKMTPQDFLEIHKQMFGEPENEQKKIEIVKNYFQQFS